MTQDDPTSPDICQITGLSLDRIAQIATVNLLSYADDIQDDALWQTAEDYGAEPIHLYMQQALRNRTRLRRVDHVALYHHLIAGHEQLDAGYQATTRAATHWAARTVALGMHDADIFSDYPQIDHVPTQIFLGSDQTIYFVTIGDNVMAAAERAMAQFFDLIKLYGCKLICASVGSNRLVIFVPPFQLWKAA